MRRPDLLVRDTNGRNIFGGVPSWESYSGRAAQAMTENFQAVYERVLTMTRTDHLLTCLMEECAEVAQRASKALRFGLHEIQPGQQLDNAERIEIELYDLMAVWELLALEPDGLSRFQDDRAAIGAKRRKVEQFMEYSKQVGRMTKP